MSIVKIQNTPNQINMLAAQRSLYSSAKAIMGTQMILSGPVAVCATLLGILRPELKGHVALWGIIVLFFDLAIFTPWQKRLRESGARVQEIFDCTVLNLPWNDIKTGKKPEPELIHERAMKFGKDPKDLACLKNWYPLSVQSVPTPWGRIICQRTNVWWDSKLRRNYASTVFFILILTTLSLIGFGIYKQKQILEFIAYVAAPMASAYVLGYRQITEHREAADRLDKLKEYADKFWAAAIGGATISSMNSNSRLLQDEIFESRKKNPPIFDFIFKLFRNKNETLMNKGAEELIAEAKQTIKQ